MFYLPEPRRHTRSHLVATLIITMIVVVDNFASSGNEENATKQRTNRAVHGIAAVGLSSPLDETAFATRTKAINTHTMLGRLCIQEYAPRSIVVLRHVLTMSVCAACSIVSEQISANAHQADLRFHRRAQKSASHVSFVKKYNQSSSSSMLTLSFCLGARLHTICTITIPIPRSAKASLAAAVILFEQRTPAHRVKDRKQEINFAVSNCEKHHHY